MIKWGFDYGYINDMPLDEYYEYLELMNKHNKDEAEAARKARMGHSDNAGPPEAKPIGSVAPRK